MQRANGAKVGLGCALLFLAPFAGGGVLAGVQAVREAAAGDWKQAGFLTIFALAFGGVGFVGGGAAIWAHRRHRELEVLKREHPDQPWNWRPDWRTGRVNGSGRGQAGFIWFFAILWNLISAPSVIFGLPELAGDAWWKMAALLLFPVVGIGLLVWAVRTTLSLRRFGQVVLELDGVPCVIGHGVSGTAIVRHDLPDAEGADVTLTCVRRYTTGSGKNRSTREEVLWKEERTVPRAAWFSGGGRSRIPIGFAVPSNVRPTDEDDSSDRILWRLALGVDLPGIDLGTQFELPVFRTAASDTPPPQGRFADLHREHAAQAAPPPSSSVRTFDLPEGLVLEFPAARNKKLILGVGFFTLIWTAITVGLVIGDVPLLFPIAFGLFDLILLLWTANLLFLRRRAVVSPQEVLVRSSMLGLGGTRAIPSSEVDDVELTIGMTQGTTPYYDLKLVRSTGTPVTVGGGLVDKNEARWLASRILGAIREDDPRGTAREAARSASAEEQHRQTGDA